MERAATFMRGDLGADFGLLLCADDVVPFYESLGWRITPGPTLCHEPSGRVEYEERTMILPCGRPDWPTRLILSDSSPASVPQSPAGPLQRLGPGSRGY